MKTGYDSHFRKLKQGAPAPSLDLKKIRDNSKKSRGEKKMKRAFPVMPLFSFLLIAGGGLLFLNHFDSIESVLKKVEFSMGTAYAEEAKAQAKTSTDESTPAQAVSPDAKVLTVDSKKADDSDYLFKLAERKKQLDDREAQLNKLAEQIEKQKSEIAAKLAQLEEVRQKISAQLQERIKADEGKVEVLVQMYTNMKPAQAAKIFETLDEDLVIEILSRMKKKNAADILNLVKAEKAQVLAERYTGYRSPASTQ